MTDTGKDGNSDRFFTTLLQRAYEEPVVRADFRDDLLRQLKTRQQTLAAARRQVRRRKVVALYGLVTAAAASVAFFFALPAVMHHQNTDANGNPGTEVAPGNLDGVRVLACDPIEVRGRDETRWRRYGQGDTFQFTEGMQARMIDGPEQFVGLNLLDEGAKVVLGNQGCIRLSEGRLVVDAGKAAVYTTQAKKPLGLCVGDHDVALQPGCKMWVEVPNHAKFALNGAPAPHLVLFEGDAYSARTKFAAEHVYQLYDTPTGKFPNRQLGKYELENKDRMFFPAGIEVEPR